jgi:transcriptional regulator with XRE-family HTH domain
MKDQAKGRVPLADALRQAIQGSGLSYNRLGRLACVDPAQLSRYMLGERDLTVAVASRVCLVLGHELTKTGEILTEPLAEPPPTTRSRPEDKPPAAVYARGQGRRVDLEEPEATAEPGPPPAGRRGRKGAGGGKAGAGRRKR